LDLAGFAATVLEWALRFLVVIPAIVFHEVAHGYSAYLLGDPTAKNAGRLSLNPIKHIDPFGTILLPLALIAFNSRVVFGYAKPVPVNPRYFQNYKQGMVITGLSGPGANLAMAFVAGLIVRLLPVPADWGGLLDIGSVFGVLVYFCYINLVLLFFNLIPIPGLDGSRVIEWFLKGQALMTFRSLERYTFIILFAVLFILPGNVLGAYLGYTALPLFLLFTGLG
jgi:Zn-dependent protease